MRDLIEIVRIVDKKWYLLHKPYLLPCVGCEINKQASLIIHDAILTDQLGVVSWNNHAAWDRDKSEFQEIFIGRGTC